MAVVLAAAAVFCCVAAADDPLRRPTVRELPQERNLTGMFTGAWADVQQQQQRPADLGGAPAADASAGDQQVRLRALHRLLGVDSWGREADDANYTNTKSKPAVLTTLLADGGGDPGLVECLLASSTEAPAQLRGTLTLRTGAHARKYAVRGLISNDSRTATFMAIPSSLSGLVASPYLASAAVVARSFVHTSYKIEKYHRNAALWLRRGDGRPGVTHPENFTAAGFYEMPPKSAVRKTPRGPKKETWKAVSNELARDPCVWFGDLEVSKTVEQQGMNPSRVGVYFALSGELTSLTCNRTLSVEMSYGDYLNETDRAAHYLYGGIVVTVMQLYAMRLQTKYADTQSTLSRVNSLAFLNVAVLDWTTAQFHWDILDQLPLLLRPVLGICFFHVVVFHLCVQHSHNALEAASEHSLGNIMMLPLMCFPVSIVWWTSINRIRYFWIPCLFLQHTFWVPQIIHSAYLRSGRPITPLLLFTTLVSRLYFAGYELVQPSLYNAHQSQPTLFLVLSAYVILQTAVVVLQRQIGPTFFFPDKWMAKAYNYHVANLPPQFSRQQPVGIISKSGGARKRSGTGDRSENDIELGLAPAPVEAPSPDCVICQSSIETTTADDYMLAPCEHLFHTTCLTQWMQHKLECPVCRRTLPNA
ncbi:Transmembrane E3 ubiquitin-protein ligase 1 [Diplonema papillatum]|nr:Transmembrane E3 ubiquitin-protein ligase 1 [Diplonema papillatum]